MNAGMTLRLDDKEVWHSDYTGHCEFWWICGILYFVCNEALWLNFTMFFS